MRSLEYNYFEKDIMYQYNKELTMVIITKLDKKYEKSFCIDGKTLETFLKIDNNLSTLEIKDNKAKVKGAKAKIVSETIEKPEFDLSMGDINYTNTYSITKLKEATKYVANDNYKPILKGVLFDEYGNYVATDSIKMFYEINNREEEDIKYSVPIEFIKMIDGKDEVKLSFSDSFVCCESENQKIYSKLYSGNIPNVKRAINNLRNKQAIEIKFIPDEELTIVNFSQLQIICDENDIIKFKFKSSTSEYEVTYQTNCKNRFEVKLSSDFVSTLTLNEENTLNILMYEKAIFVNKNKFSMSMV